MTDQQGDATAICVLGMHRGGTSAIAGALHALGAYLGPEAHLMKARAADNPKGFFEHQLLTDLNDEILWALGGSWYEPPPLERGWETDSRLDEVRVRARSVLQEDFGSSSLWGWKDPRTCLTLAFWQPLLPRPRYVLCVRNPIDVARSLQARDGLTIEKGVDLWMRHMTRALYSTRHSPTLLVAYDDIVEHPDVEIDRLVALLSRPVPEAAVSKAQAHIVANAALRHHQATLADAFASPDGSYAASAFYAMLKTLLALQRLDGPGGDATRSIGELFADSSDRAHRDERLARRLPSVIAGLEADVTRLDAAIANQKATLDASEAELRRLHVLIQHLVARIHRGEVSGE